MENSKVLNLYRKVGEVKFAIPSKEKEHQFRLITKPTRLYPLKEGYLHEVCQCQVRNGLKCAEFTGCPSAEMMVECDPTCGSGCINSMIGKGMELGCLSIRPAGKLGLGVFTNEALPADIHVMEYVGETISPQEHKRRILKDYKSYDHFYGMTLKTAHVVDPTKSGNYSRFINSRCRQPNCEARIVSVNGMQRISIRTVRRIAAGEELSYQYNSKVVVGDNFVCQCGDQDCVGGNEPADPTECRFCNLTFPFLSRRLSHEVLHKTERPSVCAVCNGAFKTDRERNEHLEKVHRLNRNFSAKTSKEVDALRCPISPERVFKNSATLKQHMHKHDPPKSWQCPSCEKSYNYEKDLKHHLRLKHPQVE